MLAKARWDDRQVELADQILEEIPADYRKSGWGLLKRSFEGSAFSLYSHNLESINDIAVSPCGRYLVSVDYSNVILWEIETGRQIRRWSGGFSCVAYSPDGKLICAGSLKGYVFSWDAASGA